MVLGYWSEGPWSDTTLVEMAGELGDEQSERIAAALGVDLDSED
jgi:hypothetical protein